MKTYNERLLAALRSDPRRVLDATMRAEPQPEERDWRQFLEEADFIIQLVGQEYIPDSGRARRGVDLRDRREAVARLLAEVDELYIVALDDWATRNSPLRPAKRLEDNWDPDEEPVPYDYSPWAGCYDADAEWGELWDECYRRPRGNPGKNRSSGATSPPPVAPLRPVYRLVRDWWRQNVGGFQPIYGTRPDGDRREPHIWYNSAGRFLLLVAQEMDTGYVVENCRGLYETLK